jgi:hypothetical protein
LKGKMMLLAKKQALAQKRHQDNSFIDKTITAC